MEESIAQKHCPKCGEWKVISEFHHDRSRPSGLAVYCNGCAQKYCVAHREQLIERAKKYNIAHPIQIARIQKKYYIIHQEQVIKHVKKYNLMHREQINARTRKHYAEHPDKILAKVERRRALKAHAEGNGITAEQWSNLQKEYNYLCAYCNEKKPLEMDHVISLSAGGRHDIDNVVPTCRSCNSSKGASSLLMFLYRRHL